MSIGTRLTFWIGGILLVSLAVMAGCSITSGLSSRIGY